MRRDFDFFSYSSFLLFFFLFFFFFFVGVVFFFLDGGGGVYLYCSYMFRLKHEKPELGK